MVMGRIGRVLGNARGAAKPSADPRQRTMVAAAVVLLEAAHADGECTGAELDHVIATLGRHFGIDGECAGELLEVAHRERRDALDLWSFTNQVNQQFSREERLAVMEAVWRVIHADGVLEKHEDHLAHKLANLLRLSHGELIDAKLRARQPR